MFSVKLHNGYENLLHIVSLSLPSDKSPNLPKSDNIEDSNSLNPAYRLLNLATSTMLYPKRREDSFKR